MKKLLSILGAVNLTAIGASNVIACKKPIINNNKQNTKEKNNDIKTWNKLQVETKNML